MSNGGKRRHLFISHHHKDDNEVTKLTNLLAKRGDDIRNSSIRVKPENQKRIDDGRISTKVIERLLTMKISWASTVIVLIGKDTHSRPWVNWEIDRANEQGKRIIGVFAQGATDADRPASLIKYASATVNWNTDSILRAIDGDNISQNSDGSNRSTPGSGGTVNC